MHGEIDRAAEQRVVNLLGEQPLAAEVPQRLVPDAVAGRGDRLERDGILCEAVRIDEQRPHMVRLPQSERAATRADQKRAMDQALDSVKLNGTEDHQTKTITAAIRGSARHLQQSADQLISTDHDSLLG